MTDTMVQTYEVGDRVTATYDGQTYMGTVRCLPGSYVLVQFDEGNVPNWAYAYVQPSTGERWEGSYDIFPGGAIVLAHVESNALVNAVGASHDEMAAQISRLGDALTEAQHATFDAKSAHQRDISYIAEALKDAASENDLCEVFEHQVQNIGSGLSSLVRDSFIEEASRQQDREYLVDFTFTGSTTVTASDEDAAQEMVESDPWNYASRYDLNFTVDNVEGNE